MKKIAVVGAGMMGHGIAQVFAVNGYKVTLTDLDKDVLGGAVNNIRSNLELMAGYGIVKESEISSALENVQTTQELSQAAGDADFVLEAVAENTELKQNVFAELDKTCPGDAILATNTSVISITEVAQKASNRDRIVGTHFWNPPYLVPLVEVVPGEDTSAATVEKTYELLCSVGKKAVKVKRDVPGFVGNRLQHALWREAISIVANGIADPQTVDECVKYGFGLRLPVLGPMENVDMVGTDLTFAIHDYILKHIESSPEPSPVLKQLVSEGSLGFKSGKGFQDWTSQEVEQSKRRLQEYLLKIKRDQG